MMPRLTPPRMIRGTALPTFKQVCQPAGSETQKEEGQEEPVSYSTLSDEITLPLLFNASERGNEEVPRAIFLGEQHHQPKVLSSQLQILHRLFQLCKEPKKIHIVMEHWSMADQPYLNQLNTQSGEAFDPRSDTEESTSEGFNMAHYLTIVKLVRELGGSVWGGFPPRSWAKMISKSSDCVFEQVQQLDQERYNAHGGSSSTHPTSLIPPLTLSDYHYVENISWPHRVYLKSMFRPDKRPDVPHDAKTDPPKEKSGFLAAQALKDTFLAHTMATILKRDPGNIVVAVAGLGHCEWGYGAPERLREMAGLESYIIMTKPDDGGYWSALPDAKMEPTSSWGSNKQADVVVLYEWVD